MKIFKKKKKNSFKKKKITRLGNIYEEKLCCYKLTPHVILKIPLQTDWWLHYAVGNVKKMFGFCSQALFPFISVLLAAIFYESPLTHTL